MSNSDSATVTYWNLTENTTLVYGNSTSVAPNISKYQVSTASDDILTSTVSSVVLAASPILYHSSYPAKRSQDSSENCQTLISDSIPPLTVLKRIERHLRKYLRQRSFSRQQLSHRKPIFPKLRIRKKTFRTQCYFNGHFMRS